MEKIWWLQYKTEKTYFFTILKVGEKKCQPLKFSQKENPRTSGQTGITY